MPEPTPAAPSTDDQLRSALQDAVAVIRRLSPLCKSPSEMIDLIELALISDGQLNLLKRELQPVTLAKS